MELGWLRPNSAATTPSCCSCFMHGSTFALRVAAASSEHSCNGGRLLDGAACCKGGARGTDGSASVVDSGP